jgi:hypothetical protein
MARRRHVVRLGIPALIVAGLAVVALWRVGAPAGDGSVVGTAGSVKPTPIAKLENVQVREITSARTFWIGSTDQDRSFVVLDPDVKWTSGSDGSARPALAPGQRLTLVGMVRPAPAAARAMQQWRIDEGTARSLAEHGTYLHATEVQLPTPD